MSNKVDERITRIRFDNDQFERGVATSMQSLDRLKNKLESTESVEAFTGIQRAADKTDFSGLEKAISSVGDKFSYLRMIAINVLSDIASRAVSTGIALVKNLSTDNIAAGWEKYDQEVQAVQTIMVTLDDTTIEEVEEHLKKVGWYADETSYSYNEMVGAMSKLISSGVGLNDATDAVLGIANAAAAAGVSTKKAQQAFYNFSQAFGAGYMQLLDWRSIELLNMGTPQFKKNIIRTAVELGKIVDLGNDMYVASSKYGQKGWENSVFNVNNMRESLSDKWFDNEVMNKVLGSYTNFANKVYELQMAEESEYDTASQVIQALREQGENLDEYSAKAFIAGQEAKTFAEAIDSVKDAVSTKWKDTFKMLFGNYEEAKVLWTDLANDLYDLFAASGDVRNKILAQWNDPTFLLPPDKRLRELYSFPEFESGREMLTKGLYNLFESVVNIVNLIKSAWREIFPAMDAVKLLRLTRRFLAFTERIKSSTENLEGFRSFLVTIFSILDKVLSKIGKFIKSLKELGPALKKIGSIAKVVGKQVWQFFKDAYEYLNIDRSLSNGAKKLKDIFDTVRKAIENFDENSIHLPTFEDFLKAIEKVKTATAGFREKISNIFSWIREKFNQFMPVNAIDGVTTSVINLEETTDGLAGKIKPALDKVKTFFINTWATITAVYGSLRNGAQTVAQWLRNTFGNVKLKDILGTTILGVMTWFEIQLALTVGRIGKAIDALTDIAWAFSKVLLSKAFEIRIKAMRNYGLAILAIAGALYIVSRIDNEKIAQAGITVGMIAVTLAVIAGILAKVEGKLKGVNGIGVSFKKGEGLKLTGKTSRTGIVGLVVGVLGMVLAVKFLYDMINENKLSMEKIHQIANYVSAMVIALGAAAGLMQALSGVGGILSRGNKYKSSAFAPVALATAMLIMIRVFERLDQMKIEHAGNVILGMIGILGSLFLLSLFVGRISAGAGFGILAIVASVWLAVIGVQRLGELNIDLTEQGPAILIVAGLIFFLAYVQKFAQAGQVLKKGERFKKAQTNFISIVVGLIACVGAIYVLSQLSTKQLFNGVLSTITVLGILFGGLYVLMGQASKIAPGAKTGGTFFGLGFIMLAITAMMSIITIAMHFGAAEVWQAAGVLVVIFGALALVLSQSYKLWENGKSLTGLAFVIITLIILLGEIYVMAKWDFKTLISSMGLAIVLLLSVAAAVRIISGTKVKSYVEATQIIGFMAGFLLVLVIAVGILSKIVKNTDGIMKSAGAMAILGLTVTAMFAVVTYIGKAGSGAVTNALYGAAAMAIVIGAIVLIASLLWGLINAIAYGRDIELLKKELETVGEIAFLMGAIVSSLIAGLFVGGARKAADELSEFTKRLLPFANTVSKFPNDFAQKTAEFGKAILALQWYGFWTGFLGGIGERGSLKRLATNLKESAEPIREASIAFSNVNVTGLNKAISALTSLSDLASSISLFGAIFMRFKLGMLSGAIKAFTSALDPVEQSHVDKAGYVAEIFKKFSEMPTRERANLLGDQKSLLSMSISLWTSTWFLKGIVQRLGDMETSDLYNAQTNTKNLVELFTTISNFANTLDKNLGVTQVIFGSKESTLVEYMIIVGILSSWLQSVPLKNLATKYNTEDLQAAADNVEALITVFMSIHNFASQLDAGGGVWQMFSGSSTGEFNEYTKLINQLPGVADAVILYGKKFLDPGNVNSINAAVNVTNSLGDAFHNLADQDLTARLQAVAQAIRELGNSGIEHIPEFFSDEQTAIAVVQAIDNLVEQFRQALLAEYMKGTIGGYLGAVMNGALNSLKSFDKAFYERGQAICNALLRGIRSKFSSTETVGKELGNAVVSGMESKESLDINSPSKKMYTIGEMAAEGFKLGIMSQFEQAEATGEAVGNAGGLGFGIGLAKGLKGANISTVFQKSFNTDALKKKGGFFDGILGLFGGKIVEKETGEEKTIEEAVQNAFDPLAELKDLVPDMEKVMDQMGLNNMFSSFQSTVDDLKQVFSPKGVQASAESMEKGLEVTKDILSQLNGVPADYESVLEQTFTDTSYVFEDYFKDMFGGESVDEYIKTATEELENLYNGAITDLTGGFTDWSMSDYFSDLEAGLNTSSYEYPITPVLTDENGNKIEYTDWQSMLGGSGGSTIGKTVAGYTAEDVRNLTLEIYHLEDALYSLKEAMKDQQVTHSGELTIRYSNETDFVDRIQTAIIGEIRREIRG